MRRTLIAALVMAGLLAPVMTAGASATQAAEQPPGSIGIRIVDAPVGLQDDPRAKLWFVDRLAPDQTISRRIEVSNTTSADATVKVYAAAATLKNGTFTWAVGHETNELTGWTSLSDPSLQVPAGGTAMDTVEVKVPAEVSSGVRYAVIWAEVSGKGAPGGGVKLVNRVGLRMYLTIGSGNLAPANFAITGVKAVSSAGGAPSMVIQVRNTGARPLTLTGILTLSNGPGGISAGPFTIKSSQIISPQQTVPVTAPLNRKLPGGKWTANVQLTGGSITRQATIGVAVTAAVVVVNRSEPDQSSAKPAGSAGSARSSPALAIGLSGALILLLIGGAAFWVLHRRSRQSQP